jgi:hypothetical protein
MDYEYHNKTGPVDESSPFVIAAKKRKLNTFASQPVRQDEKLEVLDGLTSEIGNTGPHSVLDSPSKTAFGGYNTPNRPHLREPDGKHYLFSQDNKPLPAVPSHIQNAWEPRTPASIIDFSSGGETPNTPAQDSDAATPDTSMASKMGRLMNGGGGDGPRSKSPKKVSRRESWLGRMFSSSPSPSKEDSKFYSKKAENRIMKRRSKNRKANLRDEYDSDDSRPNTAGKNLTQAGYARQAGDFFSWVEAHPHLPSVLSFWFQLLVNSILGLTCLYFIYTVWAGIQADVNIEASKYEAEIMKEISHCFRQYNDNRCDPDMRVPAMEHACGNWEACMKRDPKKIAKASVTAKTFAGIFNAFVEEFSYKSMVWIAFLLFLRSLANSHSTTVLFRGRGRHWDRYEQLQDLWNRPQPPDDLVQNECAQLQDGATPTSPNYQIFADPMME